MWSKEFICTGRLIYCETPPCEAQDLPSSLGSLDVRHNGHKKKEVF